MQRSQDVLTAEEMAELGLELAPEEDLDADPEDESDED